MYIRLDSVEKVKEFEEMDNVLKSNLLEKVKEFVRLIENNEAEADLISGRQEVDAKSLLGIFSLDLTKPIQVRSLKDSSTDKLEKLLCRYMA